MEIHRARDHLTPGVTLDEALVVVVEADEDVAADMAVTIPTVSDLESQLSTVTTTAQSITKVAEDEAVVVDAAVEVAVAADLAETVVADTGVTVAVATVDAEVVAVVVGVEALIKIGLATTNTTPVVVITATKDVTTAVTLVDHVDSEMLRRASRVPSAKETLEKKHRILTVGTTPISMTSMLM